jgi:anti-sigma B factor antagonist
MQGIEIGVNQIGARGDIVLLKIKGYVDTTTSSDLYARLSKLIKDGYYRFVVDMGGVNYVSSAGWGVFVGEIRDIRENGGDLKIVQMTPDVYEVFAMLEFNKILDYYDTLEESINDFDISLGLDITKSTARKPVEINKEDIEVTSQIIKKPPSSTDRKEKKWSSLSHPKIDDDKLPLVEKIKKIIVENPAKGIWEIKKDLNSQRFGYEKVNFFKLRSLLVLHNLETKEKRFRFYRSR